MKEQLKLILLGAMIGGMGGAIVNDISHMALTSRVKLEMEQCERDLPRSQHCRIVAVPVDKD